MVSNEGHAQPVSQCVVGGDSTGVVSVDGRGGCCVGACVSPRRARARVSEQMVCREQQQARGQTTREQRETVQVHHEQLVSGGSRPGGQAGRGWYLFETRSDGGIASLAYRRAGTSWAKQMDVCVKMDIQCYCKRKCVRGGL